MGLSVSKYAVAFQPLTALGSCANASRTLYLHGIYGFYLDWVCSLQLDF